MPNRYESTSSANAVVDYFIIQLGLIFQAVSIASNRTVQRLIQNPTNI